MDYFLFGIFHKRSEHRKCEIFCIFNKNYGKKRFVFINNSIATKIQIFRLPILFFRKNQQTIKLTPLHYTGRLFKFDVQLQFDRR